MVKKAKYIFFLAIIGISTIAAAIPMSQSASAATASLYLAPEVKQDAIASTYRISLALCTTIRDGYTMNSNGGNSSQRTVSANDVSAGKWYFQGSAEPKLRTGYLVDSDDGEVQCRNLFNGHDVAKTLGWGSNIELACGIGLERTNGSNCENGSGDFTNEKTSKNEIFNKIEAKYKNKSGGTGFTGIQTYVMAAHTYITTCGAKPVINLEDANPDQKNSDDLQEVKVVTGTGVVKTVLYRKGNNDDKAFKNVDSFDYIVHDCNWMKDQMNEYAARYANYIKDNPAKEGDQAGPGTGNEEEEPDTTTCKITGIGWILCPVLNFMALISDTAYSGVDALLEVEPLSVNTSKENGVFTAWSVMRDIANVAFVIAFLIIVMSQVTSIGISNYGIKKMLPRLIIAAILVNSSYWICAIAVDISNIIGSSLKDILEQAGKQSAAAHVTNWSSGNGWQGIVGGLIAGAAAVAIAYAALASLIPALITVAFAIAMVFITLSARQALIILWVVAAPLAFVAYLLPNTEKFYKTWFTLGRTLLLLYAIIALLFGASSLASVVVMNSSDNIIIQIMGGVISVVPMLATPFLIKASSGIAGKVGAFVNNPNKGPFDAARKRAQGLGERIEGRRQETSLRGRRNLFAGGRKYRKQAERDAMNAGIQRNVRSSEASYIANRALNDPRFRNSLAGGVNAPNLPGLSGLGTSAPVAAQNAAMATAIQNQQSIRADEIKAASLVLQHMDVSQDAARALAGGGEAAGLNGSDFAIRAAAMQRVANTGDIDGMNQLLDGISALDQSTRQDLVDAIGSSSEKPAYLSASALAGLRAGKAVGGDQTDANGNAIRDRKTDGTNLSISEQLVVNAIKNNTYSAAKIAGADKDDLKALNAVMGDAAIDNSVLSAAARDAVRTNADNAQNDSRLKSQIGKNKSQVETLAGRPARPSPTPPPPTPPPAPPTP